VIAGEVIQDGARGLSLTRWRDGHTGTKVSELVVFEAVAEPVKD
jgi:hypothetical protein